MAKIYIPTYEDVKVVDTTNLQLRGPLTTPKPFVTSLDLGTTVLINESKDGSNWVNYTIVEKRDNSIVICRDTNYSGGYPFSPVFPDNLYDNTLQTTFTNIFSTDYLKVFTTDTVPYYTMQRNQLLTVTRRFFYPSYAELSSNSTGDSICPAGQWGNYIKNIDSKFVTRSPSTTDWEAYKSDGTRTYVSSYYPQNLRPAAFLNTKSLVEIDGENYKIIPPEEVIYTSSIATVQIGDYLYKITDSEARDSISNLQTALGNKQDTLTFDSTPTQDSTNPVTSGGIYNVIGDIETALAALIGGNS